MSGVYDDDDLMMMMMMVMVVVMVMMMNMVQYQDTMGGSNNPLGVDQSSPAPFISCEHQNCQSSNLVEFDPTCKYAPPHALLG